MLYPLKFHPILKEKLWGGNKLENLLNKPASSKNIGESWEVSTVKDDISIVANGVFKGKTLVELIKKYTSRLVGECIYQEFGDQFPLLFKFIDAKEDLSIQLHPNDILAKARHNSFGKTEMWYVVQADVDARLIVGFNKDTTKEEYQEHLNKKTLVEVLNVEPIMIGDSYFINTGTIHAIGAGALIAEIQEASDITYRVYDWNRKDTDGKYRDLHTDLALDALDLEAKKDYKQSYAKTKNHPNTVSSCNYFTTNYLAINSKYRRVYTDVDSFKVYMCVKGKGTIRDNEYIEDIHMGETILIPASSTVILIEGINLELLEVYISL